MSFDQRVALFSAIIASLTLVVAFGGLLTVILQLRDAARQRESDARQATLDGERITREQAETDRARRLAETAQAALPMPKED